MKIEMEKVLEAMPNQQEKIKAEKILEINPNHPIFDTLVGLYKTNQEDIKNYTKLLYNQALLIEGFKLKDTNEFSKLMCDLMVKNSK